ncbi:phytanoyl-CoA dioxygenase family protein [Prauserella cavernicola]|uniref:Phytanoyl-CoA dioxygenase family protein n=1 Tax=Prauserella cavernicola TaxID=2800127 RepID=A0A934V962_9PSEU|nr:phytanoyl-CoA dioxygenase family protein [Prauserella cavernicola]MBK1788518.1 phytanoyl-CoA dioxygenase family protein [Prauserella cavernicola]
MALTPAQVEQFVRDGFVRLDRAFPSDVAGQCLDELWAETGCDRNDPATWTRPVIRLGGFATEPFQRAASTTALHTAFDQLAGERAWVPRLGLGTFPVRFPVPGEPGDDGWHLDASFAGPEGEARINLRSRERALLMLFLFSEVGPDDAPTRIRVGSHLDVPPLLKDDGDEGREWLPLCQDAVAASEHRPVELATGDPGDVYLCHPFLVHAAQPHRGRTPRFIAQPPLHSRAPLDLDAERPSPIARAVLDGLNA